MSLDFKDAFNSVEYFANPDRTSRSGSRGQDAWTYIRTYIHTYMHTYMQTDKHRPYYFVSATHQRKSSCKAFYVNALKPFTLRF